MQMRQQTWQHILIVAIGLSFVALVFNLWLIRAHAQQEARYFSQGQLLMSEAIKMESVFDRYLKGEIQYSGLLDQQVVIDRLLADLQKQASDEDSSAWKIKADVLLSDLEDAWLNDKRSLEKMHLSQDISETFKDKATLFETTARKLVQQLKDHKQTPKMISDKGEQIALAVEKWVQSFQEAIKNNNAESLSWRAWDGIEKSIASYVESETTQRMRGRADQKTRDLISSLSSIRKIASDMKANAITKVKLKDNLFEYDSTLFEKASRVSLHLLEKPASPMANTILAIVLVLFLGVLNITLYFKQKNFQDLVVAEVAHDREEIEKHLQIFTHEASSMIDGNLNVEFTVTRGPTETLAQTMNQAIGSIGKMMRKVVSQIDKIQRDIQNTNNRLHQAEQHFGNGDKLISSALQNMNSVSSVLKKSSDHSKNALSQAGLTIQGSQEAIDRIRESLKKVSGIGDKIITLREQAVNLNRHHDQIQDNINDVEDATEQTVILALNAAIQAAVASQGGQGFSIVATEMQELSDQIEEAMKKITHHLKSLSEGFKSISSSISDSTEVIEGEIVLKKETAQCLEDIESSASQLEQVLVNAARATSVESEEALDVATRTEQVSKGMKALGDALFEIKDSLQVISADSSRLFDDVNSIVLWEDNHAK